MSTGDMPNSPAESSSDPLSGTSKIVQSRVITQNDLPPGPSADDSPDPPNRPSTGSRKSSGTVIIPRDSSAADAEDERYDGGDARAMSPRRSSDETERMGDDARHALEQQAQTLQSNLLEIIERVDSVKSEHEKLEGGNKFLQSYIGELMQTSKLTSVGAGKTKNRGRNAK